MHGLENLTINKHATDQNFQFNTQLNKHFTKHKHKFLAQVKSQFLEKIYTKYADQIKNNKTQIETCIRNKNDFFAQVRMFEKAQYDEYQKNLLINENDGNKITNNLDSNAEIAYNENSPNNTENNNEKNNEKKCSKDAVRETVNANCLDDHDKELSTFKDTDCEYTDNNDSVSDYKSKIDELTALSEILNDEHLTNAICEILKLELASKNFSLHDALSTKIMGEHGHEILGLNRKTCAKANKTREILSKAFPSHDFAYPFHP